MLVIDVGGSRVKLFASRADQPLSFRSGPDLTPAELVERVRHETQSWEYDAVSIGFPGPTGPRGPTGEPGNLGNGWVGFDFSSGFGRPVRIVNDAAMQALGSYTSGRMLFLGLGTGLGSAVIGDHVIFTLELGSLPHRSGGTLADRLGKSGLERYGVAAWARSVREAVEELQPAFAADHVVLGGGNADLVDPLPPGARRGGNEDAFTGGFRLWEEDLEHHDAPPSGIWRVVW